MKFTDYLFKENKALWDEILQKPFVTEMGKGTLDKIKFRDYLIQDYLYLKEYSKVFCMGVIKSTTMDEMKFYYNSIKGTMEDETAVHIKYLEEFGMSPEDTEKCNVKLVNESYTSYMKGISLTGDVKEIAMAVMPCTWSYQYIGKCMEKTYKDSLEGNFYKPWIDIYASKEFEDFTQEWIDYINEICKDVASEEEKKKLLDIFTKSSIYEMKFWDMAYND
ncbi:thiaminase II [Clostridium chauvoei]|uniref:Aminopyrimidine aminohydrolase n=2 Tax=Clostridium chauvoei TaxID=46867 RepID=S6EM07_9CLOT|nr:thiaminase II [Clostridium chauvoei]ATD55536.1 thiaminase II [Clostridium chauvoei]ATD56788.1 thiaminase II [Clostridium chauvoei]MBX7281224.1 thiaminase II [Clostridium chauvoei]MBX7283706.1 thiaminase II [Clostridium chauvoei]MBX7286314.1 thiaminase II [Clostridium chauvoei]